MDVSTSTSIGIFSDDVSADYARYIKATSYSEVFYYYEQIVLPTETFKLNPSPKIPEDFLNATGKLFYNMGPDQFRRSCGDKFYYQEPMGADLFVTLRIDFHSLQDKSNFDQHVGAGIGDIFKAGDNIQQIVNKYHIDGSLEVSGYQIGGDVTQLPQIFNKDKDHYYVTTCDLKKLDDCNSAIDGVIKYVQNKKKGFANQVGYDSTTGKITGNAAPIHYQKMEYSDLGLKMGASKVTTDVLAARMALGGVYAKNVEEEDFVNDVLDSVILGPNIVPDARAGLQQDAKNLAYNINLLENQDSGAIVCYSDPDQCVATAKQLIGTDGKPGELMPIDEDVINSFKDQPAYSTVDPDKIPGFWVPTGVGEYMEYYPSDLSIRERMSLKVLNGGKNMLADSIDMFGNHHCDKFHKVGKGMYMGTVEGMCPDGSGGKADARTLYQITNPAL